MERWVSGLNQRFTKPSLINLSREFESRSLRSLNAVKTAERKNVPAHVLCGFEKRSHVFVETKTDELGS